MRTGSGALLIFFGLLALYMAITGKFECLAVAFNCLFETGAGGLASGTATTGSGQQFLPTSGSGISLGGLIGSIPGLGGFPPGYTPIPTFPGGHGGIFDQPGVIMPGAPIWPRPGQGVIKN